MKLYYFPKYHEKFFGHNKPVDVDLILEKIFGIPPLDKGAQIDNWERSVVTKRRGAEKYFSYINPYEIEPRWDLSWEDILEWKKRNLVTSLIEEGLRQPILVEEMEDYPYKYLVYEGGHRVEIAKFEGFKEISAVVIRSEDFLKKRNRRIAKEIEELRKDFKWYQKIDLGEGIVTPGHSDCGDIAWRQLRDHLPKPLGGLRVLDLGCNAGAYCVRAALEGAEVVGVDCDQRWLDQAKFVKKSFEEKYQTNLKITFIKELIENVSDIGIFDIVIASGVLYHIRYPMDKLAEQIASFGNSIFARFQRWPDGGQNGEDFSKELTKLGYRITRRTELIGRRFWFKYQLVESESSKG